MRFLPLVFAALAASPAQGPGRIEVRFIGNMAFVLSDGETSLLTDFPFQSGFSGYMSYDMQQVPLLPKRLCLITHGHADHFDLGLFEQLDAALIAPPDVLRRVRSPKAIPFAEQMRYRDILVEAIATPHATVNHYSYVITWHGRRFYLSGDTESADAVVAAKGLDVAFLTPWLLQTLLRMGRRVDAGKVVVCHQQAGERLPRYPGLVRLGQGEAFSIRY